MAVDQQVRTQLKCPHFDNYCWWKSVQMLAATGDPLGRVWCTCEDRESSGGLLWTIGLYRRQGIFWLAKQVPASPAHCSFGFRTPRRKGLKAFSPNCPTKLKCTEGLQCFPQPALPKFYSSYVTSSVHFISPIVVTTDCLSQFNSFSRVQRKSDTTGTMQEGAVVMLQFAGRKARRCSVAGTGARAQRQRQK
jgi:hypothetical protein